jgi:hypothetical protein
MLKIECDCGQKGYIDYMFESEGKIILSLDIERHFERRKYESIN